MWIPGYGGIFQSSQVHFAKLRRPLCYFSIWLFCQVDFTSKPSPLCQIAKTTLLFFYLTILPSLPSPLCQIAKFTLLNCHVRIAISAFQSCQLYISKWPSPFHPVDSPNELQAAHDYRILWAARGLKFFPICQSLYPKNSDCTCLVGGGGATSAPLPSLCFWVCVRLDGYLRIERSPFKITELDWHVLNPHMKTLLFF